MTGFASASDDASVSFGTQVFRPPLGRSILRLSASLGLGTLIVIGSTHAASAVVDEEPSAIAFAIDVDLPPEVEAPRLVAEMEVGEPGLEPVEAVAVAPIEIPGEILERTAEIRIALPDPVEIDLAMGFTLASGATAPDADPESASADAQAQRNDADVLDFDGMRVPRWVVETILRAADVTGVDPVYMMALADKESSFLPGSKAGSSSAEGLFQFVAGTWLEMVRSFGARHGLAPEAAAIQMVNGQLTVADEAMRSYILGLRRDTYLSALMAAEMMKRDRVRIERRIGRRIDRSEFYLAHFFGVDSASKFMKYLGDKPRQSAPRFFPAAARANRALFFAKQGRKIRHLSVAEVFDKIDEMIDRRLDRYEDVTAIVTAEASL